MKLRMILSNLKCAFSDFNYSVACRELVETRQLLKIAAVENGEIRRAYDEYQMKVCRDKNEIERKLKTAEMELANERGLSVEMAKQLDGKAVLDAFRAESRHRLLDAYDRQNSGWRAK